MYAKIVRNMEATSSFSNLVFFLIDQNDDIENYNSLVPFLKKYPRDCLLKNVLGENLSYEELKHKYYESKREIDNNLFVKVYPVSRRYCIGINNDDILVYTFGNSIKIGGKRVFNWLYPDFIVPIGKTRNHSLNEIVNDFKTISTIDFYQKYYFNKTSTLYEYPILNNENASAICHLNLDKYPEARFYDLSDSLGVLIDVSHVYLFQINDGKVDTDSGVYISDNWFYTDKQILRRLTSMPIILYGRELSAYWVSPL